MTENYLLGGLICAVIAGLALWAMRRSWIRRQQQAVTLAATMQPVTQPAQQSFDRVLYVVTHPAGQPLVRVSLPGLVYRGYATVTVHPDGVIAQVTGEQPAPLAAIHSVTTCQTSLAKTVEKDGLVAVHWQAGQAQLVSIFRFPNAAAQQEFINLVTTNIEGTA